MRIFYAYYNKKRRLCGRMEGSMNNFGKRSRLLFGFLLSVIMLLVAGVPTLAAGEGEPLIKISIDPFAVIMVIAGFILVAVLLIAALISINKKISGARTRVKRLSKIETEETVQLYDELDEAKWDENETAGETPRRVLLEDDFAKTKGSSAAAAASQKLLIASLAVTALFPREICRVTFRRQTSRSKSRSDILLLRCRPRCRQLSLLPQRPISPSTRPRTHTRRANPLTIKAPMHILLPICSREFISPTPMCRS